MPRPHSVGNSAHILIQRQLQQVIPVGKGFLMIQPFLLVSIRYSEQKGARIFRKIAILVMSKGKSNSEASIDKPKRHKLRLQIKLEEKRVGSLSNDNTQAHLVLFWASFLDARIQFSLLTDRGSDLNIIPTALVKAIQQTHSYIPVRHKGPPSTYKTYPRIRASRAVRV